MMKSARFLLLLMFVATLGVVTASRVHAQVAEGQEMISLPGDGRVHELTLNAQVVTTVTFPASITLVSGYGLVLNAAAAQELVDSERQSVVLTRDTFVQPVTIVHYAQASPDTLALRAVRKGTPCYLTVRCESSVFLFKLVAGDHANLAVTVSDPAASVPNPVREVKVADVMKSRTAFSGAELVGILSKARQREFLQTVNPGIYVGWKERRGIELVSTNGDIVSTITEVQQWPQKDALVLRSRVQNKGAKAFRFKPVDTKVRVGNRAYAVQLADGNGIVPPGGTALLDVVLQGNATGGKEFLAIDNEFGLEIAEDTAPPAPNDLLPPPQPLLPVVEYHPKSRDELPPKVYYDGANATAVLPDDPADRRGPLPNLYPGK